jgi:predicted DNA-binding transcriptional regulator AlpA
MIDSVSDAFNPISDPLLVSAAQASSMCGISEATWWRWDSSGRVPESVKIGKTTRWRTVDLRQWVEAGCPNRREANN